MRRFAVRFVLILVALLGLPGSLSAVTFQKVVVSGDAAPGTTSVFGSSFFLGLNDSRGQLMSAPLEPRTPGATYPWDGIWIIRPDGALDLLAPSPSLLSSGDDAVLGTGAPSLTGYSTSSDEWYIPASSLASPDGAVVRVSPGTTPHVVAIRGQSLPWYAPPGGTATIFSTPSFQGIIGDQPMITFRVVVTDASGAASSENPIFLGEPGNGGIRIADSLDPLVAGSSEILATPRIHDTNFAGQSLFTTQGTNHLLMMDATGARTMLVERGVDTPGIGTLVSANTTGWLTDTTKFLQARTVDPSTGIFGGGLWTQENGSPWAPVIEFGTSAPGTTGIFNSQASGGNIRTSIGDGGRIWASLFVNDPASPPGSKRGLWVTEDDGSLTLALRAGDPLPDGETIGDILSTSAFKDQRGALVRVRDDDATRVLFTDGAGLVTTIAEDGELFTLAVGDERTVASSSVQGGFGDQLVLHLHFADGTQGIFLVAVPEPGTGLLVSIGLVAVATRRRKQTSSARRS